MLDYYIEPNIVVFPERTIIQRKKFIKMKRQITIQDAIFYTCSTILLIFIFKNNEHLSSSSVYAISIKPADFDRLIMPCYLGGSYTPSASSYSGMPISSSPIAAAQNPLSPPSSAISSPSFGSNGYSSQASRLNGNGLSGINLGTNGASLNGAYQPAYYGMDSSRTSSSSSYNPINRDSLSNLGQQVPRANTIDNFIALVSKIEAANPRLANNPDQLIRTLLGRFRMDNYYYDVRSKVPISEQDHRTLDLIPAILNPFSQQQTQMPYALSSDSFPEHLLDHNEKCSMYFMLSHFIDKSTPSSPPLASLPVVQLTGPNGGQKPPVLQAAGTGYPAQSANNAFNGPSSNNGGTYRYPGPSPSFGSPATSNMNSFGSGISNNPEYTGNNPYGTNVLQPNNQFNQNYNNLRNTGQYSGTLASNSRYSTPFIDGQGRSKNDKQALEFGVITIANQENAALVLNRVLMGILAAPMTPQPIRQLSSIIYPTQNILSTALKIDEDIDPLFAVTLADLWAVGAIPKAGKGVDPSLLGDNGHWNDTMCPTSFLLDRSSSIKFTTAELLGGLDGFNLGMFRRRLLSMRRNIRLSEMLRMYYSKTGFRPQFAEVGVCNRGSGISTQLDDMRRQAENYLRLYQLNTPISDLEITGLITRLEYFKDLLRQSANQFTPQEICQDSALTDTYPLSPQDQCEISKADVSIVLDSSQQANEAFMDLVVAKFAQKLGLSRQGNSLSVLTNQQDTTGYAGSYSFNAIVRNSTNTAEIGCALTHDTSRSYQGGQITDPTRLVEMFERALVNLDSEYLVRQQNLGSLTSSSSYRQSSYISSLFGQSADNPYMPHGGGPSNTGGSKVIVWFNYGSQQKQSPVAASPTNWNSQNYNDQYKFNEAKKYLRENFRGASVLAISNNREDVKAFVYDEERDIFTDIPQGSASVSSYDYSMTDPSNMAALSGPADQLVGKLLQRMCDIPAIFQYPMCFKTLSDNTPSVGYISPGRKQYWMMSPKTFFASHSVRMVFKVEGGRLRVCFGRMAKPDESAYKYQQQYPSSSITLNSGSNYNKDGQVLPSAASSSSNDYYTGLNYGICKDVSPGQEIDFTVDDPCYKKPIAECEPFYFVISEISNIGEGDPNYMCKEEGCKRFDQVKFVMTHSGVTCSSAYRMAKASWLIIVISIITSLCMSQDAKQLRCNLSKMTNRINLAVAFVSTTLYMMLQQVNAQQAGVHDFGQNRYGEKRGNFTPSEILAIILLIMTILAGLALTIGLCYYVTKRNSRGMTRVEQEGY